MWYIEERKLEMKRISSLLVVLFLFSGNVFAAASYSDKAMLTTDQTFGNRVLMALIAACDAIGTEGYGVAFHRERARYASAVLNLPLTFKPFFINVVADDPNVIADATQGGTVVLTTGNVAAQAALVTDAHIDAAISANFNNFFITPGS